MPWRAEAASWRFRHCYLRGFRRFQRTRRTHWRYGSAPQRVAALTRMKLDIPRRVIIPLIVTSVIGGVAGALLLIKTPAQTFLKVLPWLMLGATLLFAFGKRLTGNISARMSGEASRSSMVGATIFELAVGCTEGTSAEV